MAQTIQIALPNDWDPRGYQGPAWRYLHRGGTRATLIWHRRSGKDDLGLHWTAFAMWKRKGNYWYCLPKAIQARKAIWEAINPHTQKRRIDEAFPDGAFPFANRQNQEMMIRAANGSTWQVVGSDNFDTLVGSPPVGIVFSEWPLCNPAAWAYLRPIMAENGGWAIFNGTPRGRNHAYRMYQAARKEPGAFAELLPATATGVFSEGTLAAEKTAYIAEYGEEYGLSIFEQEYLCSFEAANLGAILGRSLVKAENEGRISDEAGGYDPQGAPVELSLDIGRRDAAVAWFWQPCVGGFRVVDHDKDSGLDAEEWCDRLKLRLETRGYALGTVWLPHDARAKTFAAKHSAVEIFLQNFQDVRIVPETTKADRINAARRVITRCAFHREFTEKGRDALSAWGYVYDEERKEFSKEPDHNWASHDGDAFSYGAVVMEESAPAFTKAPDGRPLAVGPSNLYTINDMWAEHERRLDRRQLV
jgi:phage terminase large subunit